MNDLFSPYRLVLASGSPRRQELMKGLNIPFEVIVKEGIIEEYSASMPVKEVPVFLAEQKCDAYKDLLQEDDCVVITADTVVILEGEILGKPVDAEDACAMLQALSGKSHVVVTGMCIAQGERRCCFSSETIVHFSALSKSEIKHYVAHYKPFDKAGAYGVQEWLGYIGVASIEGSYFNVMGLPVHLLYRQLQEFFLSKK